MDCRQLRFVHDRQLAIPALDRLRLPRGLRPVLRCGWRLKSDGSHSQLRDWTPDQRSRLSVGRLSLERLTNCHGPFSCEHIASPLPCSRRASAQALCGESLHYAKPLQPILSSADPEKIAKFGSLRDRTETRIEFRTVCLICAPLETRRFASS